MLVHTENLPRQTWQLASLIEVYGVEDGNVRSYKIKRQNGLVTTWAIQKIVARTTGVTALRGRKCVEFAKFFLQKRRGRASGQAVRERFRGETESHLLRSGLRRSVSAVPCATYSIQRSA